MEAARRAVALVVSRSGAADVSSKGGRDLVTATDVASEDVIREVLGGVSGASPVIGEERGGVLPKDGGAYWLVDPICGTRNFASGIPIHCVNIAMVESAEVVLSAVADGATGALYWAERGGGAFRLEGETSVPVSAGLDSVTVSLDLGPAGKRPVARLVGELARVMIQTDSWYVRVLGSTLGFQMVADGRLSGYVLPDSSSPVHTAAGCLLAQEAGAHVTDFNGTAWTLETRAFVAASQPLHAELLEMIRSCTDDWTEDRVTDM